MLRLASRINVPETRHDGIIDQIGGPVFLPGSAINNTRKSSQICCVHQRFGSFATGDDENEQRDETGSHQVVAMATHRDADNDTCTPS
mmetsp:Transcript_7458/g.12352  ORF Transcript_7458/g.12352 Transcript_7458/m.12352 type:complete len:88 (+) Transcript_7458:240-503(+)